MIRGLYTGASAMVGRTVEMDVISNNLANVNTVGYKRDETLYKAFPEMLIRRFNDDGVRKIPIGSYDVSPVVGRLGTGVEVNEIYTQKGQGALQVTDNPLDMAIEGQGYFVIKTDQGERYTRNGSFLINRNNELVTKEGHQVMGETGVIKIKSNNFVVNDKGEIYINELLNQPEDRPVQLNENGFENARLLDTLRIVDFPLDRYLKKVGSSFFRATEESGNAQVITNNRPHVKQGSLEMSNVNAVREMVKMIEVQRSYEASQKTITSHDGTLDKLINQMATA